MTADEVEAIAQARAKFEKEGHESARARRANGHEDRPIAKGKPIEIWKPKLVEIEDLMKAPPKRPEFIIDGLLPPGLTFLAGRPKQGKSLLCLGMALAVASGTPFWGREVRRGRVVYLDLESANWRVYDRVHKLGVDVESGMAWCFEWRRGNRLALIDMLDARPDTTFVAIDTWRKFAAPQPRSVDAYEHEQSELEWLSKEATVRGISICAIGHTVKNPSPDSDVFAGIGGSSAITGNSDAVMLLRREGEDGRVLHTQGRDLGEGSYRLRLDDHLRFHCLGDASLVVSDSELRYLLAIHAGMRLPSEIATELQVSRSAVSQMLGALHEKGLISKQQGLAVLTRNASQLVEASADAGHAYRHAKGR